MLRDYQVQARDAILDAFKDHRSTLAVAPTGCGKTRIADAVLAQTHGNAIFVAHREELLAQAKGCFETHARKRCEIEMGENHASEIFPADVLLASVQTLTSGRNGARRMHKFSPYDYDLLVIDEVHHATAATYRAVLDYFGTNKDLKVLGLTATPERADEEALGQIFESVAFDYSVIQAINDGWLVPVAQQLVQIQTLDFSHIHTVAGDLAQGELAAVMEEEKNLYGICDAVMRELGDKKAIMFTVSVRQAQLASEILNRYKAGVAEHASGATPKEDRRRIMEDFRSGKFQVLVNCNLVSEGFDVPDAELLVQARPTKSKLLYQQQLGRILRPLPGTVDFTHETSDKGLQSPDTRKRAIAQSAKPIATVLDFVGNAGRHKLVRAIDILGGKISPKVRELAERQLLASGKPDRVDQLVIELERKEAEEKHRAEAARKTRLTAKATYTMRTIDPFRAFDLVAPAARGWDTNKALSIKQRGLLMRNGIDADKLSYTQGQQIIGELFRRWNGKLATLKQCNLLKQHGYDTHNMTMDEATLRITALANNGWKRP
jgi:superfamily II DNA or RNA helicase